MSEADVAEMCTQGDLANTGLFDEEEEEDEFVLVFGKRRRRINLSLAL
jgi:hypothetical protein